MSNSHTESGPLGAGPILWRRALVETYGPQCTPWGPPLPRATGLGRPEQRYYRLIDSFCAGEIVNPHVLPHAEAPRPDFEKMRELLTDETGVTK